MFFCLNLVAMAVAMSVLSLSNAGVSVQLGSGVGLQPSGCLAEGKKPWSFGGKTNGVSIQLGSGVGLQPSCCPAEEKKPWSYGGKTNGPSTWGKNYPDCFGLNQSPIAIDSTKAVKDNDLQKLKFIHYGELLFNADASNNGYTVKVLINDGVQRMLNWNGYKFFTRHAEFRWGYVSDQGTEHSIDGKKYAMEVQFVHINRTKHIAIVSILFEESNDDSNSELKVLINYFKEIKYKRDRTNLKTPLNLSNLIPESPASYFAYKGSFSSPECMGGVTWFVLPKTMRTNKEQMDHFRNDLYSVEKEDAAGTCKLVNNIRPIQPTGTRTVYQSK